MAARVPLGQNSPGAGSQADDLPLRPGRLVEFDTDEGSWISLDVAPDGRTIIFELLGNLHAMDAGGGRARPITGAMAFDSQPVFSPDGGRIAFVSDRSGAENVWTARPDGSEPRAVTANEGVRQVISPAWSADGAALFFSLYRSDRNTIELWRCAADGGGPAERLSHDRLSGLGAAASPDGRWLYYAAREGPVFEDDVVLPRWRIERLDLATGARETIVTNQGSAMRPRLSPDGTSLVYGVRFGGRTGLRLRDLPSGDDRWIAWPVEQDAQEALPTRDLLPGYAFTPDGAALLAAFGGKINRLDLVTGQATPLAFAVRIARPVGPSLRLSLKDETGPVRARIIAEPTEAPDGGRIAFSALGQIHIMQLDSATTRVLAGGHPPKFMPAWSPCGRFVTYVTWTAAEAGAVWVAASDGASEPRRLSGAASYYTSPVFAPDGLSVLAMRSSNYERMHAPMEPIFTGRAFGALRQAELIALPLGDGSDRIIASGMMGGQPQFTSEQGLVFVVFDDGLNAVALDGTSRRPVLQVVGPGYYFLEGPQPADDIKISPDGRWALVQHVQQLHLMAMPTADVAAQPIDLSAPSVAHRQLTHVGADYFAWADGGRTITWALGSRFWRQAMSDLEPDKSHAEAAVGWAKSRSFQALVEVPRDAPRGVLVLRGATVITMEDEAVIPGGDVVIVDNRIAAVGRCGEFPIPPDAEVRDFSGCFISPGLIDAHAHWGSVRRGVLDFEDWSLRAALAYGVTASLDPSTLSIDLLAYQDLQEAGLILGPRLYSTGVAVFSFNDIASLDQARDILSRYAGDYRLGNLKQYRTGNRRVRQWVAMAARELGLMPTTEGALDMKLDLTQVIDGFAGSEHSLSPAPLFDDVVRLFAETRTSYTLTLQCSHGGPAAMNAFVQRDRPLGNAKLARFYPPFMLERLFSRGPWTDPREYCYAEVAASAARIQRAGGLVGVGSHGNVPGLGQHWELQAYAAGGMSPREVLRATTLGSAETIGRSDELGSLRPGKLADLLILERDPLEEIANTLALRLVMQNGRLYEADSLDEVWPRRRPLPPPWFRDEFPAGATPMS